MKQKPENRVLRREVRMLSCNLTQSELIDRGASLAATIEDLASEESRQESEKREMKARLARIESERSRLASVVSRRAELRDVQTEEIINFQSGRVETVRMDTGEIFHDRPIRDEERQEALPV